MICKKNDSFSIEESVSVLKKGGIAILPTDTVYGFSGISEFKNDKNLNAQKKIYSLKGRDEGKPFIHLIASPEDIFLYTDFDIPKKILNCWPGALTIIVPIKENSQLRTNAPTVAFRCPGDLWLRTIIEKCARPLYSTSVNKSGNPVLETESEIEKMFSDKVDLFVKNGDSKGALPSTLIRLEKTGFSILRQGSVIL